MLGPLSSKRQLSSQKTSLPLVIERADSGVHRLLSSPQTFLYSFDFSQAEILIASDSSAGGNVLTCLRGAVDMAQPRQLSKGPVLPSLGLGS